MPFRLARSPPDVVILYVFPDGFVTPVMVAVVPDTEKSVASTLLTLSLKVTSHVSASAFVGLVVGFCLTIFVTVGATASTNTPDVLPTLFKVKFALAPPESLNVPPLLTNVPVVMPSVSRSPD